MRSAISTRSGRNDQADVVVSHLFTSSSPRTLSLTSRRSLHTSHRLFLVHHWRYATLICQQRSALLLPATRVEPANADARRHARGEGQREEEGRRVGLKMSLPSQEAE